MAGGYRVILRKFRVCTNRASSRFILARLFWMDTIERASWRELFLFARLRSFYIRYSRVSAILLYVRNSSKVIYALRYITIGMALAGRELNTSKKEDHRNRWKDPRVHSSGGGGRWWPRHDAVAPRISTNEHTQGTIIFYSKKDNFN